MSTTATTTTTPETSRLTDTLRNRIGAILEKSPRRMTSQLARDLNAPEADVIRAMSRDKVTELDPSKWEQIIRAFEPLGMLHVICNSGCVTLECFGQFSHFSTVGEYFNVQNKSLDMHIRYERIASIFAIEKPSHMDGEPTLSIQFYDQEGRSAFKVFFNFGQKVKPERVEAFERFCQEYALPEA